MVKRAQSRRDRGSIERRGDSFRVKVYAGIDPLTGRRLYLTGSSTSEREAERIRIRLLADVDAKRNARTRGSLNIALDSGWRFTRSRRPRWRATAATSTASSARLSATPRSATSRCRCWRSCTAISGAAAAAAGMVRPLSTTAPPCPTSAAWFSTSGRPAGPRWTPCMSAVRPAVPSSSAHRTRASRWEPPGSETAERLNHLGVEAATAEDVVAAQSRFESAGLDTTVAERDACSHASQDKVFVAAPDVPHGWWEYYSVVEDDPDNPEGLSRSVCAVKCAAQDTATSSCCR